MEPVSYLDIFCRTLLGIVLVAAGIGKARDHQGVAAVQEILRAFGMHRAGPAGLVAVSLPALEVGAAVLLVPAPTAALGYLLAAGLLAAFTAAIAVLLRDRRRVACRCFGDGDSPSGGRHLARNGLLLTSAAVGLAAHTAAPPATRPATLAAAAVAAVVAVAVVRMDNLISGWRRVSS